MTYAVSITSQGQITIPVAIQRKLGLLKKQRAIVSIENGKMVVSPVKDLLELGGSLKTNKKPLSNEELHELFAQDTIERLIKKGVLKKKK